MKRKLLILTSWYPSEASPIRGIFVQDQAQVLSRTYDVAVLAPRFVGLRGLTEGESLPRSRVEESNGIRVFREETLFPPRMFFRLRRWLCAKLARRGFANVFKTWGEPDIIHAHVVWPGGWMALILGRDCAIPVVLTEHSGPFLMHLQSETQRRLVRETLMHVNRVVAVSPSLAAQIHAFCPGVHIDIIGNVILTEFFTPLEDTPEEEVRPTKRFLSVAPLGEGKGIHHLLEAMQLLAQRGVTSCEVFIGGEGPAHCRLEDMARALNLSDRCHFLGMLGRSDVRHWMRRCDVFVLPSLEETFGVVLGEAMACGKPVIATRCGGPEFVVVPETGLIVDVGNPSAIAEAMDKFISDRPTFDSKIIRQSLVTRFGEEAFLCNISSVYEQLFRAGDGACFLTKCEKVV